MDLKNIYFIAYVLYATNSKSTLSVVCRVRQLVAGPFRHPSTLTKRDKIALPSSWVLSPLLLRSNFF